MQKGKYHTLYIGLFLFFLFVGGQLANAQTLEGQVYYFDINGNKKPGAEASLYFAGSDEKTTTDKEGKFTLSKKTVRPVYLFASHVGYQTDSILINPQEAKAIEFHLKEGVQLKEISITTSKQGSTISSFSVLKSEQISSTGLVKMACCNLAESFENSATITSGYTDAVSGVKQIQLLGLSGIYGQVLAENIPTIRGLASIFGWNYTPGTWLEGIQLSKGASSVVNGYEAITGQIDLEYKKPEKREDLFINVVADTSKCVDVTLTSSRKVAKSLWTNLLLNASIANNVHDRNHDHYLDMPKTKLVEAFNRWLYISPSKKVESRTGVRFLYDDRVGGQSAACHKASVYYVTDIENKDFNVYNKTGIRLNDDKGQSLGIINSFTYHEINSSFGDASTNKLYAGNEKTGYSNLIYNSYLQNPDHQLSTGLSFMYDNYDTHFQDLFNKTPLTPINRQEIVPGIFGQYTYSYLKKLTVILGLREDYNSHYGWLFTPRSNIKYNLTPSIIFRASVGCGYRAPNVIADNIGLMASTREYDVNNLNSLKIEKAWNFGGNVTFYVPIWSKEKLTLSLEYFHTYFNNQIIVDLDRSRYNVYFYNSTSNNRADVWQADASFTPFRRLDIFAAFRYNLNKVTLTDGTQSYLIEKPLVSRYRGLLNISYATKFRKWVFDFTAQLNGPTRIPSLTGYTTQATQSPLYHVYFAQITRNTKRIDIYVGVENITDYRQLTPIINSEAPFAKGFDASQTWGPIMGRKIYAGLRFKIGKRD
jgi:hypothetical protein